MTQRREPASVRDSDGRWHHKFSQSLLNRGMMCPEQMRLDMAGELPRRESAATALGTGFHKSIEAVLDGDTLEHAIRIGWQEFDALAEDPDFQWDKPATAETAHRYIENAMLAWYDTVFPHLTPSEASIEHKFSLVLHEDMHRSITITGAWDYWDPYVGMYDWKTAGREYEQWEVNRFKLQPTVYTWAAHELGFMQEPADFTYAIAIKGAQPKMQLCPTQRHQGHWDWFRAQTIAWAKLIEAELDEWPKHDQGWHCAAKWCTAYHSCKAI